MNSIPRRYLKHQRQLSAQRRTRRSKKQAQITDHLGCVISAQTRLSNWLPLRYFVFKGSGEESKSEGRDNHDHKRNGS